MRKYMTQLLMAFYEGSFAQSATARTEDGVFYSYATPIAVKVNGRFYLTLDKFSKTTTTQQKALLEWLPGQRVSVVPHKQIMELLAAR